MIFATIFGIPLGFIAAKKYGTWIDHTSLFASLIGISIPIFFLAIILKYIFAVRLGLAALGGARRTCSCDAEHPTNFYILDSIITRQLGGVRRRDQAPDPARDRARHDSARDHRPHHARLGARRAERGLRPHRARQGRRRRLTVDRRHIFRNALLPITTIVGLQVGLLLSGAVLTEKVFAWPGVGSWLVEAIENRDYSVLQGGILFLAIVFVFVNLFVDIAYASSTRGSG